MEQDTIEKKYYTIGEVGKIFGVSVSLIRFWESQFPSIRPKKNKRGVRLFTKTDIKAVATVYYLVKERGHTLQGALEILQKEKKVPDKVETLKALETLRSMLLKIKAGLD